jgi:hypothetical protein
MNTFDSHVGELLDHAYPARPAEAGDWAAVLRDAKSVQGEQQRRRRAVAAGLALAAAVALAVLWPFGGGDGVVLNRAQAARALAAVGDGPVLHIVVRVQRPGAVIDLATGRHEKRYAIVEEWYKRGAGLRERVLRSNGSDTPGRLSASPSVEGTYVSALRGFATQYQAVLRERRARVFAHGNLLGRPVFWVRFRSDPRVDPVTGAAAGQEYEVAVDETTYRPLYVRSRFRGRILGGSAVRLLSIDTRHSIPTSIAAVPFPNESDLPMYGEDLNGPLTRQQAATLMGTPALWLGQSYAGLPLAWLGGMSFAYGQAPTYDEIKHRWRGINIVYGNITQPSSGFPDRTRPYIQLREQAASGSATIRGTQPAPGTLLVSDLRIGSGAVVINGIYVEIEAPSPEKLLRVARALEPIG